MDRQQVEKHAAEAHALLASAKQQMEAVEEAVDDDRLRMILGLVDYAGDLFAAATAPNMHGLGKEQVEALIACAEVGYEGCPDEAMAKDAGTALERLVEFKKYHWRS